MIIVILSTDCSWLFQRVCAVTTVQGAMCGSYQTNLTIRSYRLSQYRLLVITCHVKISEEFKLNR